MYREKAAFFDAQVTAGWAGSPYGQEDMEKVGELFSLLPDLQGRSVLEPGCGTGRLTCCLAAEVGTNGRVTALDVSPAMIEAAKRRTGALSNVKLCVAELENCPLPEGNFDAVVCHQVFPHLNDKAVALHRIASLLRASGRLVISHFISRDEVNDVHRKAGTVVEQDTLPGQARMRELLNDAGFEIFYLRDDSEGYYLGAVFGG